jgi:hypothetical protein
MSEIKGKRERSPAFPAIPLGEAVEKLMAFEKTFGRHPTPYDKAGMAWGLKQAGDYIAALRYYGFVEYTGSGGERQIAITEPGRNLLRVQQESVKQTLLREAALRPKEIAKFWGIWGADRPLDAICIDELTLRNGFSDRGAPLFLRAYDGTISYAKLGEPAKIAADSVVAGDGSDTPSVEDSSPEPIVARKPTPPRRGVAVMDDERELTTGLLSKDSSFRLIVSGPVGVKEIEMLIKKLALDKEILADEDTGEAEIGKEAPEIGVVS